MMSCTCGHQYLNFNLGWGLFADVAFNVCLRTQSSSTIANFLFAAVGYLVIPDIV